MNNNNTTPLNVSDPGSYTYNTSLKEDEYVKSLLALGDSKIKDILRLRGWSERANVQTHILMSMFTDQQQSTTSLYLSTINHIYLFLLRCGDYESALSFHPRAPTECSSAHDGILSAYYNYRTGNRGDILLINNQHLLDSITSLPIRIVGGWNTPSCPSKFRAAVKAQHDAIHQTATYYPQCRNCIQRFMQKETTGCSLHTFHPRLFPTGNVVYSQRMKIAFKNAENHLQQHVVSRSYQLDPMQLESIRVALVSSGDVEKYRLWVMILLAGHLFLRAAEVCSIEILDLYPEEIMFDDSSNIISSGYKSRISIEACNVLRMMVVVTRKDKKKYTYQLSRDDRYPKLCIIRALLIYFHTSRYEFTSRYVFVQPSSPEKPFPYGLLLKELKSLCKDVVPVNAGKGITTHTLRNLGYVLAVWGDAALLDAVDDANHSVSTNTYKLYSRDTRRKYENWKEINRKNTAVNNIVGSWRKKLVVEHRRNRESGNNTRSIIEVAKQYVLNVLKVSDDNANFRKPHYLFSKSVTLGSSLQSDEGKIYSFFDRFGSIEEREEVVDAFRRFKYRITNGMFKIYITFLIFFYF